jgi:hypothetical protein
MNRRDLIMRSALMLSVPLNFLGAIAFGFPNSVGGIAGLPETESRFYTSLVAVMVAIFGFAYAWLALQPKIDRPLVVVAAAGKLGVFMVATGCWLTNQISAAGAAGTLADLILGLVFLWWLFSSAHSAQLYPSFDGRDNLL